MAAVRDAFERCRTEERTALVTFVTAGHPSVEETPDILLNLEAGGADIIEVGMPFNDPLADGPTIQIANRVALENNVNIDGCFDMISKARKRGLKAPVLLMGYFNPVVRYGEEVFIKDAKAAGVNGFVVADLPHEEAGPFRKRCVTSGLTLIPLVAPVTSEVRLKEICRTADSFIYVVSRMGVTGASGISGSTLPPLLKRVRQYAGDTLTAIGFGVRTREDFIEASKYAEGVVVGSQIINVMNQAEAGVAFAAARKYCSMLTGRDERTPAFHSSQWPEDLQTVGKLNGHGYKKSVSKKRKLSSDEGYDFPNKKRTLEAPRKFLNPSKYGDLGGCYVPESLIDALIDLEAAFVEAREDPAFWKEYYSYHARLSGSGHLQLASRLSEQSKGAKIWLQREDLNHTGSYKIHSALGQALLAKRLGKTKVIADTGAGEHGVATAMICAILGLECTIFMAAADAHRQTLHLSRMKVLGARLSIVSAGSRAATEAMRHFVCNLDDSYYVSGSAVGPHPLPLIVRTFQSLIGNELKAQMHSKCSKLPDAVVACIGSGANAVGAFHPFIHQPTVKLIGVEAFDQRYTKFGRSIGIVQGARTYVYQDDDGQILDVSPSSPCLAYPALGPELAFWKDAGLVEFTSITSDEAIRAFLLLSQHEGIVPALEAAHAIRAALDLAKTMRKDQDIVVCLTGRGDNSLHVIEEHLGRLQPSHLVSNSDGDK